MENQGKVIEEQEAPTISVMVKPTNDCNFDCDYCFDKGARVKRLGKRMSKEDIIHILDMINRHTNRAGWYWHGGELTLMGKDFFRDIQDEFHKRYATDFLQSFQSNGYLIHKDREWIDMFEENTISLGLSYDIIGQDVRSSYKFDVLTECLDRGVSRGAITVLTSENIDKMILMYNMAKQQFGEGYSVIFNTIFEEIKRTKLQITKEEYANNFIKFIKYWIEDLTPLYERTSGELIFALAGYVNTCVCNYTDCREKWACVFGDGDIYPCDREMSNYNLGNINKFQSFKEVFTTEAYSNYRKDIDTRYLEECDKCPYLGVLPCRCVSQHTCSNEKGSASIVNEDICEKHILLYNELYYLIQNMTRDPNRWNKFFTNTVNESRLLLPKEIEDMLTSKGHEVRMQVEYEIVRHTKLHKTIQYKVYRIFNPVRDTLVPYDLSEKLCPKELLDTIYQSRQEEIINILKGE